MSLHIEVKQMDIRKLVKYENGIDQSAEQAMLDKQKLERLDIKDLMAIPYEEIKDYLPCRSNNMVSYKKGETHAYLWRLGSKKKKRVPFPLPDGCYVIGPDGIPNGKPLEDDGIRRKLWRWQDRDWEGLLVRDDDYYGRRYVYAYYGPDGRFGVLATPISKRKVEKDAALDWLKSQAKKNKNAKAILKRLEV